MNLVEPSCNGLLNRPGYRGEVVDLFVFVLDQNLKIKRIIKNNYSHLLPSRVKISFSPLRTIRNRCSRDFDPKNIFIFNKSIDMQIVE
jgi:hypothetical protein